VARLLRCRADALGGPTRPQRAGSRRPTVDEIADAVQQVGYDAVIERDKTYSREYEERGRVLVKGADDTKNDLVQAIGAYIELLRE